MINNKKIIICSAVLVIMIIGVILTAVFLKQTDDVNNHNESGQDIQNNDNLTQNDDGDVGVVDIYSNDYDLLTEIEIITPDETIKFYKTSQFMWMLDGMDINKTDTSKTWILSNFISNMKGKSLVETTATELKKYGLYNPKYIVNAKFDAETITFYGGNKTPLEDGYYFKIADSDAVYTLYASDFETMFAESYYYRHIPNFSFTQDTIKKITINKNDSVLELQPMKNPIAVNNVLYADWEMILPSYNTLDLKMSNEKVLEKLEYVGLDGFVKDDLIDDKTLTDTQYASVTIEDKNGNINIFRISPCDANTYYVRINDDPWTYLAFADRFDFVDVPPFQLVNKFIHFFSLDDLSSFVVKTDNKTYNCNVSYDGDITKYSVNGKEIEKQVFSKDVFQNIIGLLGTDLCSDAVYSNPVVTIEYTLTDGTTEKAELVSYNERNYAVFKNGKCGFIVLKKEVESMLNVLDNIK